MNSHPMLARSAEQPSTRPLSSPRPSRATEKTPDVLVKEILGLIAEGQVLTARQIAASAAQQHPNHPELRRATRALNEGKATPKPGTEPCTRQEYAWLRQPPGWARGLWVALIGPEVIASGETLATVMDTVRNLDLPYKPLVHRVE